MEGNLVRMETGGLELWARRALILAIGLLPIFIIPISWFPFQLTKTALFTILVAIAALGLAWSLWKKQSLRLPKVPVVGAVLAVPGAYFLSTLLSQHWTMSLMGQGTEVDTLFFVTLSTIVFFLSALLLTRREHFTTLFLTVLGVSGLLALFQMVQLLSGVQLLPVFTSPSSNLVGGWNDFGVLMGLFAAVAVVVFDIGRPRGKVALIPAGFLFLALFLLATINFTSIWWLLLAVALATSAVALGKMQSTSSAKLPLASIVVGVISILFIIWGTTISGKLSEFFAINELEIRPSAQATLDVARATYAQSTLTTFFGSGPNTFGEQWLLYRPQAVSSSDFWNIDFIAGFGAIPTAFVTGGLVTGFAWIALIMLLIVAAVRFVSREVPDPFIKVVSLASATGSVFLFVVAFFYIPSQVSLLLAFMLAGVFVASLRLEGVSEEAYLNGDTGTKKALFGTVLFTVAIVSVTMAGAIGARFLSAVYTGHALAAAQEGDIPGAKDDALMAAKLYPNDSTSRLVASAYLAEAQAVVNQTGGTDADRQKAFTDALSAAVSNAQKAIQEGPRNYLNWVLLGQIYEALIPLEVDGAYENARSAYLSAIQVNPRNPSLYLSIARIDAGTGNEESARGVISQALTIKPNYTDAILLVVQMEIAKKNIDGAIQAVQAAITTAPNNPGLWFELGLLLSEKKNFTDAVTAYTKALEMLPDYANAQYFLGLAYAELGRPHDALPIFENLARSNPDSTEVAQVLSNLRAGKPATEGFPTATPPTAPITE